MATLKQKIEAMLGDPSKEAECLELIRTGVESGKIRSDTYARAIEGGVYKRTDLELCERSQGLTCQPTCRVHVTIGGIQYCQLWRKSSVDDGAFYCDRSGLYFATNSFTQVRVGSESVCLEIFSSNLYQWADGSYRWEPERDSSTPVGAALSNEIAGYHQTRRSWNQEGASHPVTDSGHPIILYGVELEIEATGSRGPIRVAAEKYRLIPEADGSLDHNRGVEIVGFPMTLADHQNPDKAWIKFLTEIDGKAKVDAGEGYGMHVNISRLAMSELHQSKVHLFINGNQAFCEQVAGRAASTWSRFTPKNIHDAVRDMRNDTGVKYEAIARRGPKRLEVRIFRSSTAIPVFLKGVEFVASVVDFAKDNSHRDMTSKKYLEWLKSNRPLYQNVAQFLIPVPKKKRELAQCAS